MYYNDHDINYVVRSNDQWEWLMKYLERKGIKWQSGKFPTDNSTISFKTSSYNPLYVVLDERVNTIAWGSSPELYNFNQEEVSELMDSVSNEDSNEESDSVTDAFNDIVRVILEERSGEEEEFTFDEVLEELEIDLNTTFVYVNIKGSLYEEVKEYAFPADDFELDKEFSRYNIIQDGTVVASIAEEYVTQIMYVDHGDINWDDEGGLLEEEC